jgi:hypothetical protein
MLGRLGISCGLFPLTPEERGNCSPVGGRIERYELAKDAVERAPAPLGREGRGEGGTGARNTRRLSRNPKLEALP